MDTGGDMADRKNLCPLCGSNLLAREGDKIYCLSSPCTWFTKAKRKEDSTEVPEIHEYKDLWR